MTSYVPVYKAAGWFALIVSVAPTVKLCAPAVNAPVPPKLSAKPSTDISGPAAFVNTTTPLAGRVIVYASVPSPVTSKSPAVGVPAVLAPSADDVAPAVVSTTVVAAIASPATSPKLIAFAPLAMARGVNTFALAFPDTVAAVSEAE